MRVLSLGQEDPLGVGNGTHSTVLAWEASCPEEPAGLQSMRLRRKSWARLRAHTFTSRVHAGVLFRGKYICLPL